MPRLILLNGAPGSGKSTLAVRYANDRPLTLCLDLDVLRSMLGGWLDQPTEAGLITRQMGIEAARVQLHDGRDVIIPQYVGRPDFLEQLEQLSDRTGTAFVEVLLMSDPDEVSARFERRSAGPESSAHLDAAQPARAQRRTRRSARHGRTADQARRVTATNDRDHHDGWRHRRRLRLARRGRRCS